MLDTPCSEAVWRVLATHSIRQFPLHLPSCATPCAITFQLDSTTNLNPPLEASWNVMAHAQKTDFVFRRNGRVHLNRRGGRQFSRLLAAEVCASAVVMLDTPCSELVWRVLATHSIRQFPLHLSSRASPCAITFQLECTSSFNINTFCATQFVSLTYASYQLTEHVMAETRRLNSEILWYHCDYQAWNQLVLHLDSKTHARNYRSGNWFIFIFLMAGKLIVHHWSKRPIKVKR